MEKTNLVHSSIRIHVIQVHRLRLRQCSISQTRIRRVAVARRSVAVAVTRHRVGATQRSVDCGRTRVCVRVLRVRGVTVRRCGRWGSIGRRRHTAVVRVHWLFAAVRSSVTHVWGGLAIARCVLGRWRRTAVAAIRIHRRPIRRRRLAVTLVIRLPVRWLLVRIRVDVRRRRCRRGISVWVAPHGRSTTTSTVRRCLLVAGVPRLLRVGLGRRLRRVSVLCSHWELLLLLLRRSVVICRRGAAAGVTCRWLLL